jgi:hypothetical protein
MRWGIGVSIPEERREKGIEKGPLTSHSAVYHQNAPKEHLSWVCNMLLVLLCPVRMDIGIRKLAPVPHRKIGSTTCLLTPIPNKLL